MHVNTVAQTHNQAAPVQSHRQNIAWISVIAYFGAFLEVPDLREKRFECETKIESKV